MSVSNPYVSRNTSTSSTSGGVSSPVISSALKPCDTPSGKRRRRRATSTLPSSIRSLSAEVIVNLRASSVSLGQSINATPANSDGFIHKVYNLTSPGHFPILLRVTPVSPRSIDVYVRRNEMSTLTGYDWLLLSSNVSEHNYTLYIEGIETTGVGQIAVSVRSTAGNSLFGVTLQFSKSLLPTAD